MPDANAAVMTFLLNRRSRPAKTLDLPVPSRAELGPILTAAARSPDHGKLEPWRFVVLERGAMARLSALVAETGARSDKTPEEIAKAQSQFDDAHLAVAVIEITKPSEKIPEIEMTYSAGAVCLALLNAALASGWGANWLSGWPSHNRAFVTSDERIAGFIHIGTERHTPPERPRPDLNTITTWVTE